MTIRYTVSGRRVTLNHGPNSLHVDVNNFVLAPIITLLSECGARAIRIVASRRPIVNLFLAKGVWHSGIRTARVIVFLPSVVGEEDILLYLFSKTFGQHLVLRGRRQTKAGAMLVFSLRREVMSRDVDVSFNLLSDGRATDRLARAIDSILKQNIERYEINLIGPARCHADWERVFGYREVRCVADDGIYSDDRRFPVARKKNLALASSRGCIVVIMHDRIWLSEGWYVRLGVHGRGFDLYSCRVETPGGIRYLDKVGVSYDQYLFQNRRMYYLGYGESNLWQSLDGGFMVVNAESVESKGFDHRLHWYEMEDVDFVAGQRLNGNAITFDRHNLVYSDLTRHFHLEPGVWPALKKMFLRRLRLGIWLLQVQRSIRELKRR